MERLILCGGGHVALELAYIASRLDFELHVIDDRPEFASPERFPMAQVHPGEFAAVLDELGQEETDFFAVLTRGHQWDTQCVAHILSGPFAYIGMIGSRGKVAQTRNCLLSLGFDAALLEQLHAPIGLSLGGQTPAEIAVSIAAQLVQVRAARGGAGNVPPKGPGMLATIVEKKGSAPRGPGTCMLVAPDGSCSGTIGGGTLEFRAKAMALELLNRGVDVHRETFDLTGPAADLGMVCGGIVTVEFTRKSS